MQRWDMHTFEPVGRCIYCDSKQPPLTDEHVIPYGLGGDRVLPAASCKACQVETSKIENFCLRTVMGHARITMGIPTRHPKERPTELPLTLVLPDGTEEAVLVSAKNFPVTLLLPYFVPAEALRSDPIVSPGTQQSGIWWHRPTDSVLTAFLAKHGANSIRVGKFEPLMFARFLAKIAHGYAVAELGIDAFEPTTRALIRGHDSRMNQFVGGQLGADLPADELHCLRHCIRNDSGAIVVCIRLFALLSAPIYHVLVGRLNRS